MSWCLIDEKSSQTIYKSSHPIFLNVFQGSSIFLHMVDHMAHVFADHRCARGTFPRDARKCLYTSSNITLLHSLTLGIICVKDRLKRWPVTVMMDTLRPFALKLILDYRLCVFTCLYNGWIKHAHSCRFLQGWHPFCQTDKTAESAWHSGAGLKA